MVPVVRRQRPRDVAGLGLLLLLSLGLASACSSPAPASDRSPGATSTTVTRPPTVASRVGTPTRGTRPPGLSGTPGTEGAGWAGRVFAPQVTLSFPFQGYLKSVAVRPGDAIKAGQVVAELDDRDVQFDLQTATNNRDLERAYRASQAANGASAADLAASDLKIQQAELAIQAVQQRLAQTKLTANVTGIVTEIKRGAGELIGGGEPIVLVANTGQLRVDLFGVDVNALRSLTMDQPVTITVSLPAPRQYKGKIATVVRVGNVDNDGNITFPVTVAFDEAADDVIPGVPARVDLARSP